MLMLCCAGKWCMYIQKHAIIVNHRMLKKKTMAAVTPHNINTNSDTAKVFGITLYYPL